MNRPVKITTSPIYRAVKPVRDPARRRFVKGFPCIGCGRTWGIDPMHTGPHGLSQKACDFTTLPGCRRCHDAFDQDPRGFARQHHLDIAAQVRQMNALYLKHARRKAA